MNKNLRKRDYLFGNCRYFAAALYYEYGWQIVAAIDCVPCGKEFVERLCHCWVLIDGKPFDVYGYHPQIWNTEINGHFAKHKKITIRELENLCEEDLAKNKPEIVIALADFKKWFPDAL
jgi:hypothetical protein